MKILDIGGPSPDYDLNPLNTEIENKLKKKQPVQSTNK